MATVTAYLSAREAADYCGVSEKTVRNWLASGRLQAEKSAGSFRISQHQLDTLKRKSARTGNGADRQMATEPAEVRAAGNAVVTVEDVLRLVREAQADALAKAEAAAMWQTRAEMLMGQVQQLQAALEAPKEELAPVDPTLAVDATPAAAVRPWWRRLLG